MGRAKDSIFYIVLDITAAEFRDYYSQDINSVITTSHTGEKVLFPANILQPFVTYSGIQGQFKIVIDKNAKFKSISRVI